MRKKELRLFYSRRRNGEMNFGDDISPLLVEEITKRPVVHARVSSCDYAAIGSILEMVEERRMRRMRRLQFRSIKVWGSGCLTQGKEISSFLIEPIALRGQLTKKRLGNRHDVPLGDPGLLFDRLYRPTSGKKYKWGLIMHYSDENYPVVQSMLEKTPSILNIPVSAPPLEILRMIGECEYIASSSLHGLVAADCYHIPNVRLRVGPDLDYSESKFHDYASAIARPNIKAHQAPEDEGLDCLEAQLGGAADYFSNTASIANNLEKALRDSL